MKLKRKVSANLGRTQHRWADNIYKKIRRDVGPVRPCPFYNGSKYPQFNVQTHNELNPDVPNPKVPIEEFDFARKANKKWGLQAYCKVCYKAYRSARIKTARNTWVKKNKTPFTDEEIRNWYIKNVGPTMVCSVCKLPLPPSAFRISRSMEKGLHNVCIECSAASGNSVREQVLLADGDWSSWKRAVMRMRSRRNVRCVGRPRSVGMGACKKYDDGKKMHADHRVPLRAGGLHDAKNFQALCSACNIRKLHQIDARLSPTRIRSLVGSHYKKFVRKNESFQTIERRLKGAVREHIRVLADSGTYRTALEAKKKEVNGQWVIAHAYRKGMEWLRRGDVVIDSN